MTILPNDSDEGVQFFQKYRDFFSSFAPIPDEDWDFYVSQHEVLSFSKGEYFIRTGDYSSIFGFVAQGLFK